jgi:hypothetical protein
MPDEEDHGHCPYGHDHPQPVMRDMGFGPIDYCGCCLIKYKTPTEMVPCRPWNCEDLQ